MDAKISLYEVLAGPKTGNPVNSFFLPGSERRELLESPTRGGPNASDGLLVGRELWSSKGTSTPGRAGVDRGTLLASDPFISGRTITRPNQAAASKYDIRVLI
jgi:hypothetical protein